MKKDNISLIVIGTTITMLLIVLIGSTFAYFTALNSQGSTSLVSIEGGKMLINYSDGTSDLLTSKNIEPSNTILVNKTFTLTGTNTTNGLKMPYKVGVQYTSTFSNGMIHYYIKEVNRPANSNVTANYVIKPETGKTENDYKNQTVPGNDKYTGYTHGTFKNGKKYTEMVTGEFPTSLNDQTITFNLIIQFPDNGLNQDSEKGKSLIGKIVINHELTISEYISDLNLTDNGLEEDKTYEQNLRYVGASPKNYINFNNETWRIVGVFNDIPTIDEQGNKKTKSLVKIVRNDSLGDYSWDTSESSTNKGWGINEWSQADLMTELNTDYINPSPTSRTTLWFNGEDNAKNGTYEYKNNIKSDYIDKIAKVSWYLGGADFNAAASSSYNLERIAQYISNPSDGVTRTYSWDGKIALIYPSDYGYASTNNECRNYMSSYNNNEYNCKKDNWLYNNENQWTLSPFRGYANIVLFVNSSGGGFYFRAASSYGVRPALFLKSDILIASGTGEEGNPYLLG